MKDRKSLTLPFDLPTRKDTSLHIAMTTLKHLNYSSTITAFHKERFTHRHFWTNRSCLTKHENCTDSFQAKGGVGGRMVTFQVFSTSARPGFPVKTVMQKRLPYSDDSSRYRTAFH